MTGKDENLIWQEKALLLTFSTVTFLWLLYLWFVANASWLHPELLGTATYIWCNPDESIFQTLRKMFDWKAFDPNVNRVRPLNDIVEVFDATIRPYLSKIIGPHPSFSLSAVVTASVVPLFTWGYLRRVLSNKKYSFLFCLLLMSTIGYLSLVVGYIRPAKKLNLILLCASLYYGQRFSDNREKKDFYALMSTIFASFFADELGLANYVIGLLLFWPALINFNKKWLYFYLFMPVLFLTMTKWILPFIYIKFSVHGAWDALSDPKKFTVFRYLFSSEFHQATFVQMCRSVLSTLGISKHNIITETIAGLLLFSVAINRVFTLKKLMFISRDRLFIFTLLIYLCSLYATLLDWYPFPHEVSYLGSFNYYYHSSMVVLVIIWFGLLIDIFLKNIQSYKIKNFVTLILYSSLMVLLCFNFMMFKKVNRLVQIIHHFPYSTRALNELMYQFKGTNSSSINLFTERENQMLEFEITLKEVFGNEWKNNGFYTTFQLIYPNPIMTKAHLEHLTRAYFPGLQYTITVVDEGR